MVNDLPVPVWQKTSTVSPRMPRGKKCLQITHGKRLTCDLKKTIRTKYEVRTYLHLCCIVFQSIKLNNIFFFLVIACEENVFRSCYYYFQVVFDMCFNLVIIHLKKTKTKKCPKERKLLIPIASWSSFVSIRPPKKGDPAKGIPPEIVPAEGSHPLLELQSDSKTVVLSDGGKTYSYDWVFDGDGVSQEDIFQRVIQNAIF